MDVKRNHTDCISGQQVFFGSLGDSLLALDDTHHAQKLHMYCINQCHSEFALLQSRQV